MPLSLAVLNALRQSEENHLVGQDLEPAIPTVLNALRQSEENHSNILTRAETLSLRAQRLTAIRGKSPFQLRVGAECNYVLNALRQSEENHVETQGSFSIPDCAQRLTAIRGKSRGTLVAVAGRR